MKSYDTYIFDLDGTLLNSLPDLVISTNHALDKMGFPQRSVDEIKSFIGNGVRLLVERAVPAGTPKEKVDECFCVFKEHYIVHGMDNTQPFDGIVEMLNRLKKRRKKIAVVSNKFYDATQELCSYFFPDILDVAVGENSRLRKKPNPDLVDEALRIMNVSKENAVYVGDSDVDIQTALNCQLPCISVLWGYRDRGFLLSHGATVFAQSPFDIINY